MQYHQRSITGKTIIAGPNGKRCTLHPYKKSTTLATQLMRNPYYPEPHFSLMDLLQTTPPNFLFLYKIRFLCFWDPPMVVFVLFFFSLFFWLCRVSLLARRIFVEACGIFHCGAWALHCGERASLQLWHADFLFSGCGTGSRVRGLCSLRHTGSVVVAHGLSCPAACGILVPRPGIEPVSPAQEGRFSTTGPPGKSLAYGFCHGLLVLNCNSLLFPNKPIFAHKITFIFKFNIIILHITFLKTGVFYLPT